MVVGRTGDQTLTSEAGDVTRRAEAPAGKALHGLYLLQAFFRDVTPSLLPCSHLQGMFFRTARMLEAGVKPVYVFDGMPPAAKKEELARRWAS